MPPGNSFALLQQLAEQRRDNGTRKLGAALARFREANDRLQLLIDYRSDYQARLGRAARDGIQGAGLRNYQSFLANLERAIEQQSRTVADLADEVERLRAEIAHEQRQVESFTVLLRRRARPRTSARTDGRSRCRTSSPPIPSCASPAGRGVTTDSHGVVDDPQHHRCDGTPAVFGHDRRHERVGRHPRRRRDAGRRGRGGFRAGAVGRR